MSRRSPHSNKPLPTNPSASARETAYLAEGYDADQSTLYNALSGAGFGHSGPHQREIPGHAAQIDDTLLDAVTSAAGVDLRNGAEHPLVSVQQADGRHQRQTAEEAVSLLGPSPAGKSKRKRTSDAQHKPSDVSHQHHFNFRNDPSVTMSKRQKTTHEARNATAQGPEAMSSQAQLYPLADDENSEFEDHTATNDSSVFFSEYTSPLNMSDARASGVYSAAALFRKPTEASRKYTRPPMSKLFTSLELAPERFIRLQSAAKAFMLDPEHEERLNCVGNRAKLTKFDDSKGDMDMAKLRLYHCVKEFLESDGIGEEFFGRQSEGAAGREWFWPRDGNKVISLVTPLLRRMITNERQRQYALESRKTPATADAKQVGEGAPTETSRSQSRDLNSQVDPQLAPQGQMSTRSSTKQRSGLSEATTRDPIKSLRFAVVRSSSLRPSPPQRFMYAFTRDYGNQSFGDIIGEAREAHSRCDNSSDSVNEKTREANGQDTQNEDLKWIVWAHVDGGRKKIEHQADWEEVVDAAETEMPYINGELTVIIELQRQ